MKKASRDHGFILCFLINLVFRMGWLLPIVGILVLHFIINVPVWLIFIPIAIWVLHALLITIFVFIGNKSGNSTRINTYKENINPYSKKNEDYLKRK